MVLETTATLATPFLCYYVAENLCGVSGVLAVVVLSISMAGLGKYSVSPDVKVRLSPCFCPCFSPYFPPCSSPPRPAKLTLSICFLYWICHKERLYCGKQLSALVQGDIMELIHLLHPPEARACPSSRAAWRAKMHWESDTVMWNS
jgi:hypothetical protein